MGWLDRIPRAGNLYIGGLYALYQKPNLFAQAGITHILSVLDYDIYESGQFDNYGHLHIRLDDHPNEDLLQHFARSNEFIESALADGGAVFIHCAMGKSRSATIASAYLMKHHALSPVEALAQICEGRPVCSPNPGFMEQLSVYAEMLQASDVAKANRLYLDWLQGRYTGTYWKWEQRDRESKL